MLARAADHYGVQVVFYVFASTHFHLLLIVSDNEQMADFMEYVGSNIARELGHLYEWPQKFWGQPYSHVPVSEEPAAQMARLKYLASNSVKEGLVEKVAQWPGLHAAHEILAGEPLMGTWVDRTYLYNQGRSGKEIDFAKANTTETLEPARLPCWKGLSQEAYRERIAQVVREVEEEARIEREATGKKVLGRKAILRKSPHSAPAKEKRSRLPLFHAASREARKRFREAFKAFLDAYRIASLDLREGNRDAAFPEGSFPPGLPFVPHRRAGPIAP